jgi:hypothetical protein
MGKDYSASLWDDAWKRYAEASGRDFKDLPRPETTEDLIRDVERQNSKYNDFRKKQVLYKISKT